MDIKRILLAFFNFILGYLLGCLKNKGEEE